MLTKTKLSILSNKFQTYASLEDFIETYFDLKITEAVLNSESQLNIGFTNGIGPEKEFELKFYNLIFNFTFNGAQVEKNKVFYILEKILDKYKKLEYKVVDYIYNSDNFSMVIKLPKY